MFGMGFSTGLQHKYYSANNLCNNAMLKIRSTKSETRNKLEIQNPNVQNGCRRCCTSGVWYFDFWSFGFVSDLTPYKQTVYNQHRTQQHVSYAVVLKNYG
jgi:hypothetical protein